MRTIRKGIFKVFIAKKFVYIHKLDLWKARLLKSEYEKYLDEGLTIEEMYKKHKIL